MLMPLNKIYKESVFENPQTTNLVESGLKNLLWFYYKISAGLKTSLHGKISCCCWKAKNFKLAAPRNLYKNDVNITENVASFATGKSEIKCKGSYNMTDEREDEMMKSRWRVFKFHHQFNRTEKSGDMCSLFC